MKDSGKEGVKKGSFIQRIKKSYNAQYEKKDALEVQGRGDMLVRGCRRILFYSTEEIRLLLHSYVLNVKGEDLYCTSYFFDAISIEGKISSIEMSEKENIK